VELLAAAFAALAVFALVTVALRARRVPEAVDHRFARLERRDDLAREELMALPFKERVVSPVGERFRNIGAATLPSGLVAGVRHRLLLAGQPMTVTRFFVLQAVMLAMSAFLIILFLLSDSSGLLLLVQLIAAAVLSAIPIYWLRIKAGARRRALLRALPDAVDLMVTTVEAGMGIDGALAAVGRETEGPLGEELRLAIRETTLGRSRREALQRLIERTQVPELSSFIQALIQAEQTGISIGQVLRIQAAEMRLKRRQNAEAMAQKAPVKMILVLILLVLPAMLLFVMGPAMMRMRDAI
jgi:tight adherence protein C